MLPYFILFISVLFCHAGKEPNREIGYYRQIAVTQTSPLSFYYELNKSWPSSNITQDNSGLSENTCKALFNPSRWVLRWIFPNKRGGRSPRNCIPNVKGFVNFYLNQNLRERLATHWPNIVLNSSDVAHWEYKWHKYGSCVTDIYRMRHVREYFETSLELLEWYNIGKVLDRHEIRPGGNYSVERVYNVVKNEFRTNPRMRCLRFEDPEQKRLQYLFEITICFTKNLILEDCIDTGYSTCYNNTVAIYPNFEVLESNR